MELLVKRDTNQLDITDGKAFVDSDVPDFLQVPRVVPQSYVDYLEDRGLEDDLLIVDQNDQEEIEQSISFVGTQRIMNEGLFQFSDFLNWFIRERAHKIVPGLWSGYRSALVQDPETKRWFRLKGVSLNPHNPESVSLDEDGHMYRIQGGQEKYSAEFEQRMSNQFNRTLEDVGIEPVMKVRGMWKYPVLARRTRPVASIVEVEGDTRLDELSCILEGLQTNKFWVGKEFKQDGQRRREIGQSTSSGKRYEEVLYQFYHEVGFTVGRLKRLMDRSGQTWSSDYEQSNAHWGNIVLYNGSDKVKIGFVDFDASCDATELSRSELLALQEREYQTLANSFLSNPISLRTITGKPFLSTALINPSTRQSLVIGFQEGYASKKRNYTNEIDLGRLQEVFTLLRQEGMFSFRPVPVSSGWIPKYKDDDRFDYSFYNDGYLYKQKDRYSENPLSNTKKDFSLSDILKKQYGYQKDLYEIRI